MKKFLCVIMLMTCIGCSWKDFTGERNIKVRLNILGNTLDWESKLAGEYSEQRVDTPIAKDLKKLE